MVIITACDEIFDKDLSKSKIGIISPKDSLVTTKTTLTFWWDEIEDADSYRLQVVSPCIDTILSVPLDTTITTNMFEATLNPGRYNWRVKALNSSTETAWFTHSLTIINSTDLSEQEVLLKSPNDQTAFGNGKIKFQWTVLPNATNYLLIIKKDSWTGDLAIPSVVTTKDTVTETLVEGKYVWGVKGFNEDTQSKNQTRTVYVDLTAPSAPTLQLPAKDSTITGSSVTLQWDQPADNLTAVYDSLYVSMDNSFAQSNLLAAKKITGTTYNFSNTNKGKFYWRVKAIDAVGNKSAFSGAFNFTFQ